MAIHLIIKGNFGQAYRAAADRGVSLNQARVNAHHPDETNARCASIFRPQVARWFNEEPRQAPYPVGTLLLFTEEGVEE